VLVLFAAAAAADFQFEFVGAAEARCGAMESDVSRYLGRQALLEVGGFECTAFDASMDMLNNAATASPCRLIVVRFLRGPDAGLGRGSPPPAILPSFPLYACFGTTDFFESPIL
jgi:hypothetical protein